MNKINDLEKRLEQAKVDKAATELIIEILRKMYPNIDVAYRILDHEKRIKALEEKLKK